MPGTAVVILNYNGKEYLSRFLPILIKHTAEAEIIVADNQSTDNSLAYLQQFPEVRVIELEKNYGFAGGYNEALKQVKADYYVLVNSDVEVTEGWLHPLVNFLNQHPEYAAAQPKILDEKHRESFEYAGAAGGFIDVLGYPYCRGRLFNYLEKDLGQYDEPIDVFWASGACIIFRSEVFQEHHGFDTDFFAHMEEIDLCWRVQSAGYKVRSVPSSIVYHVGGGTLNKSNPKKTYLNFRNNYSLLIKNLPLGALIIILPGRIILDTLAGIMFWLDNGNIKHFFSVLSAMRDSLWRFRRNYKKRNHVSLPPQTTILAWEHFFLGKKKFSDINSTK